MLISLGVSAAAFLITHVGLSSTPLRDEIARRTGGQRFLILYSAIAVIMLAWMVIAYIQAPHTVFLWVPDALARHAPIIVMPFAFLLLVAGVTTRNPTNVGMERAVAEATVVRGILRITRHPVQWAILPWSAAHMLANGDAASLIFFGTFFVLSAIGPFLIDRKLAATLGEEWTRFSAVTSNVPFAAIARGRQQLDLAEIGWRKVVVALTVFAAVLWLHPYLFGVPPY